MRNEEAQDLLDLWDLWEFGQRKPHLYTCKWVCTKFLQFTAPSSLEVWRLAYYWLWNISQSRVLCKLYDSWVHDQETWAVMYCHIFLVIKNFGLVLNQRILYEQLNCSKTHLLINCINYTYSTISNIWPMTASPFHRLIHPHFSYVLLCGFPHPPFFMPSFTPIECYHWSADHLINKKNYIAIPPNIWNTIFAYLTK